MGKLTEQEKKEAAVSTGALGVGGIGGGAVGRTAGVVMLGTGFSGVLVGTALGAFTFYAGVRLIRFARKLMAKEGNAQ
jgi:hypothetical protein